MILKGVACRGPSKLFIALTLKAHFMIPGATFERLRAMFGLEFDRARRCFVVCRMVRLTSQAGKPQSRGWSIRRLLAYNDTWDKIDLMLDDCMSTNFREHMRDLDGVGWVYNWFCVDHVDYDANPRRRDMGYHNIFDHYRRAVLEPELLKDGLHFHYHPHNFGRDAHRNATHWWASSDSLQQVISRRVIDREWFPTVEPSRIPRDPP